MKILITAANGFIGKNLCAHLAKEHQIIALVRSKQLDLPNIQFLVWDGKTAGEWTQELASCDVVINLAGRSVDCRYTAKNKAEIYASRLDSTRVIGEALKNKKNSVKIWMNAASATIYRHSLNTPMTEKSGEIGTGFSVDVCQQWEKVFFDFSELPIRQIALRTAIVLGENGGVMLPFKRLTKLGFGGKMGKGNQQFSWIHIDDFCRSIEFMIQNENMKACVNLAAPNPITNTVFMQFLRKKYKMPFSIPSPKWLLEFGARIIHTETELILKSRFVLPEKLLENGFEFKYKTIDQI